LNLALGIKNDLNTFKPSATVADRGAPSSVVVEHSAHNLKSWGLYLPSGGRK